MIGYVAPCTQGLHVARAGAGVHRRHQLKARRKAQLLASAGNMDAARLQRLAQHLQHLAIKLRQFVQKQHAVMRLADLARPGLAAAANQCGGRCTMVGRPKRPARPGQQRAAFADGLDRRDFQRFLLLQRRQNTGQAAGQQRFAGAGRAKKQQVML